MIHINAIHTLSEQGNEFSMEYVSNSTGEIINFDKVVCTSSNWERKTRNLKMVDSGEIRKIRDVLIISYNNEEVVL